MSDPGDDPGGAVVSVAVRLLDALDTLSVIARYMHPPDIGSLVATLGDRDAMLSAAWERSARTTWPPHLAPLRDQLALATEATLRACEGLRTVAGSDDALRQAYRALRQVSRALEALYPLAEMLPSVSRFFLEPGRQDDQALLDRLATGAARTDLRTGVLHAENEIRQRGRYSAYVPEDYDPAHASPLIMALHGGSGHGWQFLWSWLREARSRGAILAAPTAIGDTWSLMEPAIDSGNLARVLEQVAQQWRIDRTRLLLTGMSDGGTFTLLSAIDDEFPFTHLAPIAASFHPLLLTMADPRRLVGLPVYLVHGARDWMFPVTMARTARHALTAAGANVTYREIADLSHAYPRDENSGILDWFLAPTTR